MNCSNTFSATTNIQKLTKGIGLENAKSRLSLLYPNAHQLAIQEQGDKYIVRLELTLENDSLTNPVKKIK